MDVLVEGCLPFKKRKSSRVIFETQGEGDHIDDHQLVVSKKMKSSGDGLVNNFMAIGCSESHDPAGSSSKNLKELSLKPKVDKYMHCRPYKEFPAGLRINVGRPVFCLSKRVTNTDVDRDQHRFQLSRSETESSLLPLRELGEKARKIPSPDGVAVKVVDGMGSVYDLTFKFMKTSRAYRFMGHDYSKFLQETGLRAGQKMDIWVLPDVSGQDEVDHWFALVNSDTWESLLGTKKVARAWK